MTQTTISLPFITADASGPKHLNTTPMRSTFDEITADLVQCTQGSWFSRRWWMRSHAECIDEVPGWRAIRMPSVQTMVRRLTGGKDPNMTVNPDEVAAGAPSAFRPPRQRRRSRTQSDVIHNSFDFLPLTYSGLISTPVVTTIHGFSSPQIVPVYAKYNDRSFLRRDQ